MNKLYIKVLSSFFFVLVIFTFGFVHKVNASEDIMSNSKMCDYSEAYMAWLELSDEEKKNTPMPVMCDFDEVGDNRLKHTLNSQFSAFRTSLPVSYDLRNTDYISDVKDQMQTGTCWAFSAITALEVFTKVSLGLDYVYSPRHLEYATSRFFLNREENEWGFNRVVGGGGHAIFSSAYMSSQVGPVLEEDMPFENNEDLIELKEIQNKEKVIDVNNILLDGSVDHGPCSSGHIVNIKNQINTSRAVIASIFMTEDSYYYNEATAALYYNGYNYVNHTITIIGWDDNYSKTNFIVGNRPSSDGAWIVQNSYGTEFGDNGFMYVSYEDERVCTSYMAYKEIDAEVEDNAYIYDKLGYNTAIGFYEGDVNFNYGYGMNIFDKEAKAEVLKEVSIGSIGSGEYKIYYKEGNASSSSISEMTLVGSGTTEYRGYVTHKLDTPIVIGDDVEEFSIAVYWETDYVYHPIPLCDNGEYDYIYLSATAGNGYISNTGTIWQDVVSEDSIVSIKAFTDDVEYDLSSVINEVKEGNSNNVLLDLKFEADNIQTDKLNLVVKDSSNKTINDFTVSYESNGNVATATVDFYNNLDNGSYKLLVYYYNGLIETLSFDIAFGIVSNEYKVSAINGTIYINTPVDIVTFLNNIAGTSSKVMKNGVEVKSGNVGTGMTIDDYVVIIRGDVTGDGLVRMNDVMMISTYLVEGTGLSESCYKTAGDVVSDSNLRMNDVMKISSYIVEGGTL